MNNLKVVVLANSASKFAPVQLGTECRLTHVDGGDWNTCRQNSHWRGVGWVGNVVDEATGPGLGVVGAMELKRLNAATLLSFAEWKLFSPTLSENACRVAYGGAGKIEG